MSYDGIGGYKLPTPQFPAIPNTTIVAEDVNTIFQDIADALSQVIVRDGQTQLLGDLDFNGHGLKQLATIIAQAAGLTVSGGPLTVSAGPVTFTSKTVGITQPTGTDSTDFATCAYVLRAAMNANLPFQAGNAGRWLQTDGVNATWAPFGMTQIVSNGAIGQGNYVFNGNYAVTLPDLTGGSKMVLNNPSNSVSPPTAVTTSDGWTINTGFAAGVFSSIAALGFMTAHGWWGTLSMTPPVLATRALGSGGTPTLIQSSVQLSANCVVVAILDNANNNSLIAIDPTTGAVGVPVVVPVEATSTYNNLHAVGAGGFVFTYTDPTGQARAMAGTVAANVITTGVAVALGASRLGTSTVQFGVTSTFLACLAAANDLIAFSVAGLVVTAGAAVNSGAVLNFNTRIAALAGGPILVTYAQANAASSGYSARVVTVAGVTIALGVAAFTNIATNRGNSQPANVLTTFPGQATALLGVSDNVTPNTINWYAITVAGTTVTMGNAVVQSSNNYIAATSAGQTPVNLTYAGRGTNGNAMGRLCIGIDASRMLFVGLSGVFLASLAAGVLTIGPFTAVSGSTLFSDFATGTSLFTQASTSGTTFTKITVAGTAVTAAAPVASWPMSAFTDTLADTVVNYGGTYYRWTGVPNAYLPLSVSKYLSFSGTNIVTYGNFS